MKRPTSFRPYIPLAARYAALLIQEGIRADLALDAAEVARKAGLVRKALASGLAARFGDKPRDLDHDPALTFRPWNSRKGDTVPPANDPSFLVWRERTVDHKVKTFGPGGERRIHTRGSDRSEPGRLDKLRLAHEAHERNVRHKRPGKRQPAERKRTIPSRPFPKVHRPMRKPEMIKFLHVDPTAQTVEVIEAHDLQAALIAAGLTPGKVDHGLAGRDDDRGIVIGYAVDEFGLFTPPADQDFFAWGTRLVAGDAVFYQETAEVLADDISDEFVADIRKRIAFFGDARDVAAAIHDGKVERPVISVNGKTFWQWPEPAPRGMGPRDKKGDGK